MITVSMHPATRENLTLRGLGRMIVGYLLVSMYLIPVFMGAEYLYYRALPVTANVEYYSVEPLYQTYNVDQPLYFLSDRVIKHEASLLFNDRLFCSDDGKIYEIYSSYNSTNDYADPVDRSLKKWRYNAKTPEENALCYISSQITDKRPYGILKKQMLKSTIFRIVEP